MMKPDRERIIRRHFQLCQNLARGQGLACASFAQLEGCELLSRHRHFVNGTIDLRTADGREVEIESHETAGRRSFKAELLMQLAVQGLDVRLSGVDRAAE